MNREGTCTVTLLDVTVLGDTGIALTRIWRVGQKPKTPPFYFQKSGKIEVKKVAKKSSETRGYLRILVEDFGISPDYLMRSVYPSDRMHNVVYNMQKLEEVSNETQSNESTVKP